MLHRVSRPVEVAWTGVFLFQFSGVKMTTIAVVGLGYVGLPLAVEFGKKYRTIGLDLSQEKIDAYRRPSTPPARSAPRS